MVGTLLVFWAIPASVQAEGPPDAWAGWNRIEISVAKDEPSHTTISITPRDMLVVFWGEAERQNELGRLVLTDDRFFAVHALDAAVGKEMGALADGLLDYLLLNRVLSKSVPSGPSSVGGKRLVGFQEDREPLTIAIPGARLVFSAPWSVEGSLARVEQNRISYSLNLSANGEVISLEGALEYDSSLASNLPGALSLMGWRAFRIDRMVAVENGEQRYEYWGKPIPDVASLAELRFVGTQ